MPIGAKPFQQDLALEQEWAREWLFSAALPLWRNNGIDVGAGGWFDKLDQNAVPVELPKRLRVQARQTFVFAEASRLGWTGQWRDAVIHGLDFILTRYRRDDGLFRASVRPDGSPLVDAPDLYDQAFVMLALAAAYRALGKPEALLMEAEQLLDSLESGLGHPQRGFEEARPRILPLRSNPHMHLLEALLLWVEVGGGKRFVRNANAIIDLACERLIQPETGAVGEYFDGDWHADPNLGHLREPGHQFEWAYLLDRADHILGRDCSPWRDRLHSFAAKHGVRDGVTVFSVASDGSIIDRSARLWAQTERLRTILMIALDRSPIDMEMNMAAVSESVETVRRFLNVPIRGLWRDRLDGEGNWIDEPAPASSLYHIVTGLMPLIELDLGDREAPGVPGHMSKRSV